MSSMRRSTSRPTAWRRFSRCSRRLSRRWAEAMKAVLASGNAGKVREFAALLAARDIEVIPQTAFRIETPEETGTTFLENALLKARHAAASAGLPALADDSGLEVDALGGRPGVRSARYAGDGASDKDNNALLLRELRGVPAE